MLITLEEKDGKVFVKRPSSKSYHQGIRGDKPAGIHEQTKVAEVLGCKITKSLEINGVEMPLGLITHPPEQAMYGYTIRLKNNIKKGTPLTFDLL